MQVLNAFNGYQERESERSKALQIVTWEAIRWQTWIMWNLQVTKKGKLNDPRRLIKFDWDKKQENITTEQWNEINKRFPDKIEDGDK